MNPSPSRLFDFEGRILPRPTHAPIQWYVLLLSVLALLTPAARAAEGAGNRLTYLDDFADPFYPSHRFPKLTTPQWVGDAGVETVVTYGIDDMSSVTNYERYLRPLLERLKQIDGRAPVSIFCNSPNPAEPHLQQWLKEGLSFEVHTLNHPCPILAQANFTNAQNTYHGCVDLLHAIPGNHPVAFRTPCCDSIDSASPRLFAELLARTNSAGQFLAMDSSVTMLFTTNDPALPAPRLVDARGRDRFRKYVPFPAFSTFIENYPYPYVHTRRIWEMPFVAPSDWQSHNFQGDGHAQMLEDWKLALDFVASKQGTFNFVFHPANWSSPTQHVAFVDYAVATYGSRIKFLSYREAHERLTHHLLAGQPLRAPDGGDNGVRLLDLNHDGYLDVVIGNQQLRQTRLWDPAMRQWQTSDFPVSLVGSPSAGNAGTVGSDRGVRFGIIRDPAQPVLLVRNENEAGAWRFRAGRWEPERELLQGLELDGAPILTSRAGHDLGVRFRDVDGDGDCELLVANETQNAVFEWNAAQRTWSRRSYGLPKGVSIVNAQGADNGLRFVDLNGDGLDDLFFSNEESYSIHLMVPHLILGFQPGWSRVVIAGRRGQAPELPMIVRGGAFRNNGAWFTQDELYVQNEDTARLTNLVARHSFTELLAGFQTPALGPTQSLAAIQVPANFVVELVAHEPMVQDPVYLDWDEQGRLWVVEMRDYPLGLDGHGKPGAVVRFLEDTDHDGRYDKSTVFAEGLNFVNGLIPWRKGVLLSGAPDILYAEDTDNDGQADRIERLFTGFNPGNQQHRCNGFDYGLDNWLYGANGDSGGSIVPTAGPRASPVSLSGRDFRFRPDTRRFESVEGQTQFGRHHDDWGNWFGNANPIWLWHYWLPEHYLRRNPRLAVESLRRETATTPEAGRVRYIGRKPQRLNDVGTAGYVTSANSPTPYRDELFGPEFARAVFISEPVYNSVRCEILEPNGVSFTSHRWNPDEAREFLASTDPWFRPTGMKIGPDGALYIPDMYRQFIEHPEWIPTDIKTRYNMRAGDDLGRIYRVYPRGAQLRPTPNLGSLSTAALVAAIDHPNGWQRDTAQRLLVTRHDANAAPPLRTLLKTAANPKTRLTALCTLDGLEAVQPADLEVALKDPHAAVRENAVRISESFLRDLATTTAKTDPRWLAVLQSLQKDPELRVRYQLALSLGEWGDPRAAAVLGSLAVLDGGQRDMLSAIASSSSRYPGAILSALLKTPTDLAAKDRLLRNLLSLVAADTDQTSIGSTFEELIRPGRAQEPFPAWQVSAIAHFIQELAKSGRSWQTIPPVQKSLGKLAADARAVLQDAAKPTEQRVAALQLLGASGQNAQDADLFAALLSPASPGPLQRAALEQLGHLRGPTLPASLFKSWNSYTPSVRSSLIDLLLRREEWTTSLLEELASRRMPVSDLGAAARQRLLTHSNQGLRDRAQQLLAQPASSERQKLVDAYLPKVRDATGDPRHGAELFGQHCAVCHPLGQAGTGAAPDLASVVDRSPERMLIAILDPNRAVEDRYMNYVVQTKSGDEYTGLLASETANNITLVSPSGTREILLRTDIASMERTRLSVMPEGFEQFLKPQDLADLLAHLDRSATPPRSFPGNRPALVTADGSGALRLRSFNAEIHGQGIAFETQYRNLGSWNNPLARAIWSLDVPAAGTYEVWLHWACHENEAGDLFRFEVGSASLEAKVPSTGTWDHYQSARFGRIQLGPGRQRAVFQAAPGLRAYLIDLLEVRLVPAGAPEPRFE